MSPEFGQQVLEQLQAIRADLADFGVGLTQVHAEVESLATHVKAMRCAYACGEWPSLEERHAET